MAGNARPVRWESPILIHNQPVYEDAGLDARKIHPGLFGSEYPRMTRLTSGDWILVYTIYDNNGYTCEPTGGNKLEIALSRDNARTWQTLAQLADPGRDLDNGQIIELADGGLLLGMRSVRWQESYKLPVYKSLDQGRTWAFISMIDENEGEPGSLGQPDKGIYEPHFYKLDNGSLSVMYANEKHVTEQPSYSQIISQKISNDGGSTWGEEIWVAWDPANEKARPGMPVWARLPNGKYMVVLEVCGTADCKVYFKLSQDGTSWEAGLGQPIADQMGGPYVEVAPDGTIFVTSNSHQLSYSTDGGENWTTNPQAPWESWEVADNVWASVYPTGEREIAHLTSVARAAPGQPSLGHNIQIRFGRY